MHSAQKKLSFHLKSGHELCVDSFHMTLTYGGLLEGYPSTALNKETLDNAQNMMSGLWGTRKTHTIEPSIRQEAGHPFLPSWVCIAWLTCSEPINPAFMGSELVVLWFADDVHSLPLVQLVSDAVGDLDWSSLAQDFDW